MSTGVGVLHFIDIVFFNSPYRSGSFTHLAYSVTASQAGVVIG